MTATIAPLLSWDTCAIAKEHAIFLREAEPELSEEQAFQQACEDSDLYQHEWEDLCECLTELLLAQNPSGQWLATVENFGWQKLSGHKRFQAQTGAEFLRQLLPQTDCTFHVFPVAKGFDIQNFHHDSPDGWEWYRVRGAGSEATTGGSDNG